MSDTPDFRTLAESLIETCADLQRQVLLKHTTAIIEELHAQITKRNADLAAANAELAAFRAENAAKLAEIQRLLEERDAANARVEALELERDMTWRPAMDAAEQRAEQNEKDAERYRWLRDEATQDQLYKMCDWPDVEWDDVIDMATVKDPEWERRKVATYDNPSTQCRECWSNGRIVASYKMPLLVAQRHWPPPPDRFFFGANIGPWKEGQIIGDAAAIAARKESA